MLRKKKRQPDSEGRQAAASRTAARHHHHTMLRALALIISCAASGAALAERRARARAGAQMSIIEKLEKCCSSSGVMKRGASPGKAKVERVSQEKAHGIAPRAACSRAKKAAARRAIFGGLGAGSGRPLQVARPAVSASASGCLLGGSS